MFKRVENRLYALVTIADELIVWRFNDTVTKCREKFRLVLKYDGKSQTWPHRDSASRATFSARVHLFTFT